MTNENSEAEIVLGDKDKVYKDRDEEAKELKNNLKELLGLKETDEKAIVIDHLKCTFWEDYQASLQSSKVSEKVFLDYLKRNGKDIDLNKFPDENPREISETELSSMGLGNIFEQLVLADRNVCQMREHSLGREFRKFLLNPSALSFALSSLDDLSSLKSPDEVLVEKTGVICGIVECKVPLHLKQRAFEQLSPDGFRKSIRLAVNLLNRIPEESLSKAGFPALARFAGKLSLSDDPVFILAIPNPKDRKMSQWELKKTVLPVRYEDGTFIDPEIRKEVSVVLEDYTIKTSVFTKEDLIKINEYLIARYKAK